MTLLSIVVSLEVHADKRNSSKHIACEGTRLRYTVLCTQVISYHTVAAVSKCHEVCLMN